MATATAPAPAPASYERTEQQKLTKAPIVVTFGEKEYQIKVRRILAAQEWRQQFMQEIEALFGAMGQKADGTPAFMSGMRAMFAQFPEKMVDLVCSYDPELPRQEIRENATEEQISVAFGRVVQIAFPFNGELMTVARIVGISQSFPTLASEKSTK